MCVKFQAEPIVDTIQEHEKYGNDGDRPFDRAFVNGLEVFSNFINKLIDVSHRHCFFGFALAFAFALVYHTSRCIIKCVTSHLAYELVNLLTLVSE